MWHKLGLPDPQDLEAVYDIAQFSVITDKFSLRLPSSFLTVWYYVAEMFVIWGFQA
jgi:hypothetical protein